MGERLTPSSRMLRARHSGLRDAEADAPRGARFAQRTIDKAMQDLYEPTPLPGPA